MDKAEQREEKRDRQWAREPDRAGSCQLAQAVTINTLVSYRGPLSWGIRNDLTYSHI